MADINSAPVLCGHAGDPRDLPGWLERQALVVEAWIEALVAQSGDVQLIGLLDQHAAFLHAAREAASQR